MTGKERIIYGGSGYGGSSCSGALGVNTLVT
jgi:hypothetical protein